VLICVLHQLFFSTPLDFLIVLALVLLNNPKNVKVVMGLGDSIRFVW
jgi:hypothetical protein